MSKNSTAERYYETAVYVARFDAHSYRWREWRMYREAAVRQLDRHGIMPGLQFQLRVPRDADPETGGPLDVDGDRSMEHFYLHGADTLIDTETLTVTGYSPIEGDRRSAVDRFTGTLELVRWTQVPYRYVLARDAEHAEAIALGRRLTDHEVAILVALRGAKRELDKAHPYRHNSVLVPTDGGIAEVNGLAISLAMVEALANREGHELIGTISGRSKDYHTQPPREMTEVYLYHTAEWIADHSIRI